MQKYNWDVIPAIFLDRDGVIIENRAAYVRSWDDVFIYPQALQALATFSKVPYYFVIVTNQSVVGRGIISEQEAEAINTRLVNEISQAGGRIDAVFMCPHAPAAGCDCRKPGPGLFFQAAQALPLDMDNSIMVGDALTDIAAAQAAGIGRRVLLRTGRGEKQSRLKEAQSLATFSTYDTLLDVLSDLLQ
jgi:D-glycero-D-manno-heptose 1,7-bisphosphate phosphatase